MQQHTYTTAYGGDWRTMMNTVKSVTQTRVGKVTYIIEASHSPTKKETLQAKIMRLIQRDLSLRKI